ncbi:MAG: autotransporter outer membrane beta-barrel domain-containing protein [Chlamydiae bacterium]|nr:autotransporter outer membrane beta-barrel domain-containing protein [Chlamydiota bacterium]
MTTGSGNTSIIGGRDETNNKAIAWFVKTDGTSDAINFTFGDKEITAVAINSSGLALIAGNYTSLDDPSPVLHLVYAASAATVKDLDFSTSKGKILSVSLADEGKGIAGGYLVDSGKNKGYAGIIDYSATTPSLTSLNLDFEGSINSVAMNAHNQSIIAGIKADKKSYVAIVDDNFNVAVLDKSSVANMKIILAALTGSPLKLSATLGGFQTLGSSAKTTSEAKTLTKPSALDKRSLKSNNLRLANYIDKYAEKNAFYFIPAMVEGDLNSAIESASPARNAFSLFTASNNLFFTSTGVSTHIRQQRSIKQPSATGNKTAGLFSEDDLFASLDTQMKQDDSCVKEALEVNKSQVWVQAIGAFAYQSAQNQTPAFSPASGGVVLSYENRVMHDLLVGGGFSYLYTHIHEKKDAGYANINQESLFGYASWDNKWLYADATLLFGWFQTTQKRNIDLKGFDFTSSSSPSGWQLLPHLEVGYNYTKSKCFKTFEFRINPFIMLDYANSWQEGYKEHGSSPFNIKQKSQHGSLLRTELGARFYETFMFKNFSLTIEELGGYINTQVYDTGKVNASFVGYEGSFVVETLSSAQNLGVAQVSMILNPRNTVYPTTTLFYQGEYGSEYLSNQFTCEFAWRF